MIYLFLFILSVGANALFVIWTYLLKHEIRVVRKEYDYLKTEIRWDARHAMREEASRIPLPKIAPWVKTPEDFKTYQQIENGQIQTIEQLIDRDDS